MDTDARYAVDRLLGLTMPYQEYAGPQRRSLDVERFVHEDRAMCDDCGLMVDFSDANAPGEVAGIIADHVDEFHDSSQ